MMNPAQTTLMILIVEDDEGTAELERRSLIRSGMTAQIVGGVQEALAMLAVQSFDAILLDYHLPDGDPWVVVNAAEFTSPRTPVIMVTAQGNELIASEALRRGVADYIKKSGSFWDQLPEVLDRVTKLARIEIALSEKTRELMQSNIALEKRTQDLRISKQQLFEQHKRLEYIIESTNAGTWEWNVQTGVTILNQRWCGIIGYTQADLAPISVTTWIDHLHPDDQQRSAELLDQHFSDPHKVYECEVRMRHRDGHWVWVLAQGHLMTRTSDGQPEWMFGTHEDISMRVAEREMLRTAGERMALATDSGQIGIWEFDIATGAVIWDVWMYRLFGLKPTMQIEKYDFWRSHLHLDDLEKAEQEFRDAVAGIKPFDTLFRIWWDDGSMHYIRATGRLQKDDQGRGIRIIGANWDVTETKLANDILQANETRLRSLNLELEIARDRAETASRSKSEFLSNMSHEIRTPMNAVLGMLQLLQQTGLQPWQDDYAKKAESAARTLLGILNDILDFSRVEAGKLTLDPHPFSIDRLLCDIGVILSANSDNKNIEIVFQVDPDIPDWVVADDLRLQQVLINLAGNAYKFTEHGEIVLSVKLLATDFDDLTLVFSVRDTGIGLSAVQCERIFDGFSQAESSTARRYGGSGLGLAISKRLVNLMGGTLGVTSEPGKGSDFFFTMQCQKSAMLSDKVILPALHCLVVDDNATARHNFQAMLTTPGSHIEVVASGSAAIELVTQSQTRMPAAPPFDVILVDWQMPEMGGWETCELIRQHLPVGSNTVIIMMVSYNREIIRRRLVQAPTLVDGFLVKPVTVSMLSEVIASSRATKNHPVKLESAMNAAPKRLADVRILLVEDNAFNQLVCSELLSLEGAIMTIADHGQAGIDAIRAEHPPFDVVLMDVQMPGMDGYATTRIIRSQLQCADLPIIAITANAMQSDRDAALDSGMNDHVCKPFNLTELVSVIQRHLKKTLGGSHSRDLNAGS